MSEKITIEEARQIALDVLRRAEQERLDVVNNEARGLSCSGCAAYNNQQLATAHRRITELEGAVNGLLKVLPDSCHEQDCWHWCWNKLNDKAQDEVKLARKQAQQALKGNADAVGNSAKRRCSWQFSKRY